MKRRKLFHGAILQTSFSRPWRNPDGIIDRRESPPVIIQTRETTWGGKPALEWTARYIIGDEIQELACPPAMSEKELNRLLRWHSPHIPYTFIGERKES